MTHKKWELKGNENQKMEIKEFQKQIKKLQNQQNSESAIERLKSLSFPEEFHTLSRHEQDYIIKNSR